MTKMVSSSIRSSNVYEIKVRYLLVLMLFLLLLMLLLLLFILVRILLRLVLFLLDKTSDLTFEFQVLGPTVWQLNLVLS